MVYIFAAILTRPRCVKEWRDPATCPIPTQCWLGIPYFLTEKYFCGQRTGDSSDFLYKSEYTSLSLYIPIYNNKKNE